MTTRRVSSPSTHKIMTLMLCVISVSVIDAVTTVKAAEWRIEPQVGAGAEVDDNAILSFRTDTEDDIRGYLIEAIAGFYYTSANTEFNVTPRLLFRNYDRSEFDSDDQFMRLFYNHDMRTSNFRVRGSYDRQSTRTGERDDTDFDVEEPDVIPDDSSGRVAVRGRRERFRIIPSWTYNMSDISSIALSLDYTDVRYEDVFAELLNDYSNARGRLTYERSFSQRNSFILEGTYRRFETQSGSGSVANTAGFNAGFGMRLSETTRIRALIGLEGAESEAEESDPNWVADISLVRRLQTINILAQYKRTISGGGAGTLSSRDSINLNVTRRLNERISVGLGTRAYQTNALEEDAVNFDERDYVQLRAQFIWNLSQTWFIEANYRYTFLYRSVIGEGANSNNIIVSVNYRPNPITWMR